MPVLQPAPAPASNPQPVDILLALPPDRLRQTLQLALDCAGLEDSTTSRASSSGVPTSAMLQGGLLEASAGEHKHGYTVWVTPGLGNVQACQAGLSSPGMLAAEGLGRAHNGLGGWLLVGRRPAGG